MEPIISKEEVDKLMTLNGEVRGISLKRYKEYVLEKEGKEGLKKLESLMKELNHPLEYEKIGTTSFYPISLEALNLLAVQRLFNLSDEDIQEIGMLQAKTPMMIRLFAKYIFSFEKAAQSTSKLWRTYYTIGNIQAVEYDKEKKFAIIRLENFRHHPLHCQIIKGYLLSIFSVLIGSKPKLCKETKCTHKGDAYHEFLVEW